MQHTRTLAFAAIVVAGSSTLCLISSSQAAAANCTQASGARTETAKGFMVATAHPLATKAGCDILNNGGTAIDAAVAVQAVLSVVEPHASGLGGGTIITYWDNKEKRVRYFDGLARAPKFVQADLRTPTATDKRRCRLTKKRRLRSTVNFTGRAVGVPGTVAVLDLAHKALGGKTWNTLFDAAIATARNGFPMPPYLHSVLKGKARPPGSKKGLRRCRYPDLRRLYCANSSTPTGLNSKVRNPELAKVLEEIRDGGGAAFYASNGRIAPAIVARVRKGKCKTSIKDGRPANVPSRLTVADFAAYKAIERKPVCKMVIGHIVCSAPPPAYGGMAVITMLRIASANNVATLKPGTLAHTHLALEASRLTQADRRRFIGDPDFGKLRLSGLLTQKYLNARANLFSPRPRLTASRNRPASDVGTIRTDQPARPGRNPGPDQPRIHRRSLWQCAGDDDNRQHKFWFPNAGARHGAQQCSGQFHTEEIHLAGMAGQPNAGRQATPHCDGANARLHQSGQVAPGRRRSRWRRHSRLRCQDDCRCIGTSLVTTGRYSAAQCQRAVHH